MLLLLISIPPDVPVWPRRAPKTTQIHAQEIVDLANAVRLEDVHQFHLLVRTQASVSLSCEAESLRHAMAAAAPKPSGNAGRTGTFVATTAHDP